MKDKSHAWVAVGEKFSKLHTFTEDQVRAFATDAGDTNPLHHDAAVAAASRYKKLIVSGTHTTALILGLTASHFSKSYCVVGISFSVEFRRPVLADATVQIEWEVVATSMKKDKVQRVELRGGMYDEKGDLCVQATGTTRISLPT
ncbi:(R)-specific enoyl-CoA hydratase [mine drainage metagenome]|uniref:(R)-specific enoyl-CoA hydratase n=1 Tax=mine drainage metagenome TaxID=410659 RepID=A0A1J5Q8S4_9ZZZZ